MSTVMSGNCSFAEIYRSKRDEINRIENRMIPIARQVQAGIVHQMEQMLIVPKLEWPEEETNLFYENLITFLIQLRATIAEAQPRLRVSLLNTAEKYEQQLDQLKKDIAGRQLSLRLLFVKFVALHLLPRLRIGYSFDISSTVCSLSHLLSHMRIVSD